MWVGIDDNESRAWLIAQPQTCAIVGARNAEQAGMNAKALDIKISNEDLTTISNIGNTVAGPLMGDPTDHTYAGV